MWETPRQPLRLGSDEVHVWRASLEQPTERLAAFVETLSERERERAERMRAPLHRDRTVAGHGILRDVLARYLSLLPREIAYRYGRWGKPALERSRGVPDLRFNVSHSEDAALIAVTWGRELGVDLERIREERPVDRLAQRFFSPAEHQAILQLPEAARLPAFFAVWSRKEAYIKAIGRGLTLPLDAFDVSVDPAAHPALLATRHDPGAEARWRFLALPEVTGYAAALLVEATAARARFWKWEGPSEAERRERGP